jgi:peptidoglycan/LPS O-acetylase OafA/YrhL
MRATTLNDMMTRVTIARVFYVASALFAVALVIWAGVAFLAGDDSGTFPAAFALWPAVGLPLIFACLLVRAFRRRRTSGRPPAHWPDGYRR